MSQPCEHLSQLPGHIFCAARLLCTCFSSPSWPLCHGASVELSAPCAYPLPHGFYVYLFCLTCTLSRGLFDLSAVPGGLCVLPKFVCLPSIGTPVPPFVTAVCPVTLGYLGLPSVLQGLCVLVGFVCCVTLSWVYMPRHVEAWVLLCHLEVAL